MNTKKGWFIAGLGFILFFFVALGACKKNSSADTKQGAAQQRTVVAKPETNNTHLFYSGSIQPSHINRIISPADGTVEKMFFKYGDRIINGQLLMIISSTKLQNDYRTALTDYLKTKDQYLKDKARYAATSLLYKAQIVTREEYQNDFSSVQSSELALLSATDTLLSAAAKLPSGPTINLESLSLQQIDTVKDLLEKKYDKLNIYSNATGIALYTDKGISDDAGSDSAKTLQSGSEVKENQVLVSIGNLSGITTTVYVSELDVNQIKVGQKVSITSPALPNITFHGQVTEVGSQAKSAGGDSGGSAVTFPVSINVPAVTDEQRKLIKIGMDAKVEIIIENPAQIMLPLDAVFQKNGISYVTIIDPKTKQQKNVPVTTGTTNQDNVTILSGVKSGDRVLLHD